MKATIKIALLQGTNWSTIQMPLKNLMRNWKFKHKVSFALKYLKVSHTKCIQKIFISISISSSVHQLICSSEHLILYNQSFERPFRWFQPDLFLYFNCINPIKIQRNIQLEMHCFFFFPLPHFDSNWTLWNFFLQRAIRDKEKLWKNISKPPLARKPFYFGIGAKETFFHWRQIKVSRL